MPLRLTDLDPTLTLVLRETLRRLKQTDTPSSDSPEWRRAQSIAQTLPGAPFQGRDWIVPLLPALCTGSAVASMLLGVSHLGWPPSLWLQFYMGLFLLSCIFLVVALRFFSREADRLNQKQVDALFTRELFPSLIPLLALSTAERAYIEAVGALLTAQDSLGADTTQELITILNTLLTVARPLEQEKAARELLQETSAPRDAQWQEALEALQSTHRMLTRLTLAQSSPLAPDVLKESVQQLRARADSVSAAIQELGQPRL